MGNKWLAIVIILGLLAGGGWWYYQEIWRDPPEEPELPEHLEGALYLEAALDPDPPDVETLENLAQRHSAVGYRARLALARHFEEEDEFRRALLYYQRALDLNSTGQVRVEMGDVYARDGDPEAARQAFREGLPRDDAVEGLRGLDLAPEELFDEVSQAGRWDAAAEILEPRYQERPQWRRLYAQALAELGQWGQVIEVLDPLEGEEITEDFATGFALARALEEEGEEDEALELFQQLGRGAWHRAGYLLEARGEVEEAAYYWGRSDNDEARWRGARQWELLDEPGQALAVYLSLAYDPDSQLQLNAADRALTLLEREDRRGPPRNDLEQRLEQEPVWAWRRGQEPPWPELENWETAEPEFVWELTAYREHGWQQMEELEIEIQSQLTEGPERLALARWLAENGEIPRAVEVAQDLLEDGTAREAYQLAYPRAYADEVQDAAGEFGVDPQLIWGIMREESRFQPGAESAAGAVGLMQLMPETAEDVAEQKDMELSRGDLEDPETNIRLGAYYLAQLLERFEGDAEQALAAYNAGPGNARRWAESDLVEQPEDFSVAVTYPETRDYLDQVINSYQYYLWLYGQ